MARVDMRMDEQDSFYILEINSLPSLGEHGSYLKAAQAAGMDRIAVINRMVEVAATRYFGTPAPAAIQAQTNNVEGRIFSYITRSRDRIERRVQEWVGLSSRTLDPVGVQAVAKTLDQTFTELRFRANPSLTDQRFVWCWESQAGFDNGTLFLGHIDVPLDLTSPSLPFRRDPESLYGEGVGCSRGPLAMLEFVLRALRNARLHKKLRLGVMIYADEGRDARYSRDRILQATARAGQVFVLRPANPGELLITQRRGQRKYQWIVEGKPRRPGQSNRRPGAFRWTCQKLEEFAKLSSKPKRVSVSTVDLKTEAFPLLLPHRVQATLLMTYLDPAEANRMEEDIRELAGKKEYRWQLQLASDRPPMNERRRNETLVKRLADVAHGLDMPLGSESSVWPSVAGLVPSAVPVVCGVGPTASDLYTPQECLQRISLIQRTLLLAQFLARQVGE
jgi:D-alanine-D-alanine ligase